MYDPEDEPTPYLRQLARISKYNAEQYEQAKFMWTCGTIGAGFIVLAICCIYILIFR